MPHVTTTCPECGEIELPLADIVLRVCDDDATGSCVVQCPDCGNRFAKRADEAMMIMMVTFGVPVTVWQRPAEVDERPIGLPPLQHGDVTTFAAQLESGLPLSWAQQLPHRQAPPSDDAPG